MSTYSFQHVVATIIGIGGAVALAAGAGSAEEGITVEPVEDANTLTMGADGSGMHSQIVGEASTVTVRLLKTSLVNALLMVMYNIQKKTPGAHGTNVININDIARGDNITLTGVAFKKRPAISYAKDGGMNEWTFDAIRTITILGVGTPEIP